MREVITTDLQAVLNALRFNLPVSTVRIKQDRKKIAWRIKITKTRKEVMV